MAGTECLEPLFGYKVDNNINPCGTGTTGDYLYYILGTLVFCILHFVWFTVLYLSNTANCEISPRNHRVELTGKEERLARAKERKAARQVMRLRIAKAFFETGEELSKEEQKLFLADEKRKNKKVRRLLCEQECN